MVKSLSYSTLLRALRHNSSIEDKEEYIVVKTKHNPKYYWGNFILFKNSYLNLSPLQVEALFQKEFSKIPVRHCAFAWDSIFGNEEFVSDFISQGYNYEWDELSDKFQNQHPLYAP